MNKSSLILCIDDTCPHLYRDYLATYIQTKVPLHSNPIHWDRTSTPTLTMLEPIILMRRHLLWSGIL